MGGGGGEEEFLPNVFDFLIQKLKLRDLKGLS